MQNSFNPQNEKLKIDKFVGVSQKLTKEKKHVKLLKNNASGASSLWTDMLRQSYPDLPPMTMPVWAAKNISKKLHFSFDTDKQICFISFVVSNWSSLMQSKFSNVKDKPVIPKAVFFLRFYETFLESYLSVDNPSIVQVTNPRTERSNPVTVKTVLEKSSNEVRLENENAELLRRLHELELVITKQASVIKSHKKTALPKVKNLLASKHQTINIKQQWD